MFDEDLVDSALLDDLLAPPPPLTQTAPAVESQVTSSVPAAKPKAPRKRARPASPRRLPPAVPTDLSTDLHVISRRKATEVQDALVSVEDSLVECIVITVTRARCTVSYTSST